MEQYISKSALVAEIEKLNPPFYLTFAEKMSYQDAIKDCINIIYAIKEKEVDYKGEWKNTGGFGSTWDPDSPDYCPD